jgi:hypothetical protein
MTIDEIQKALDDARARLREAAQSEPELSPAEMLPFREASHRAWRELEKLKVPA